MNSLIQFSLNSRAARLLKKNFKELKFGLFLKYFLAKSFSVTFRSKTSIYQIPFPIENVLSFVKF